MEIAEGWQADGRSEIEMDAQMMAGYVVAFEIVAPIILYLTKSAGSNRLGGFSLC